MKKIDYLKKKSDIFVALDYPDKKSALDFLKSISSSVTPPLVIIAFSAP